MRVVKCDAFYCTVEEGGGERRWGRRRTDRRRTRRWGGDKVLRKRQDIE